MWSNVRWPNSHSAALDFYCLLFVIWWCLYFCSITFTVIWTYTLGNYLNTNFVLKKLHLSCFLMCNFRLIFFPPYSQPLTISSLLWSIAVDDYILKLITIIFKIIVIMMPIRFLPIIKRVCRFDIYLFLDYFINTFYF